MSWKWVKDGEVIASGGDEHGLGDKIEQFAQPIARAIDKVAGTHIAGCGGCKQMRDRLNAGMTIAEAIQARALEFALRKLSRRRAKIFERVKTRLDRREF